MNSFKANIPAIILILFEIAIGILLLMNPEAFTVTVIILFGIVLLVIGLTYLLRYLSKKKEDINDIPSLLIAIASLILGVICALGSSAIIGLITVVTFVYGIILAISGIYKLHNYFQIKKADLPVSSVNIISGMAAILIGILIIVYPMDMAFSVWQVAGIMLLIEAAIDILSIVQAIRNK